MEKDEEKQASLSETKRQKAYASIPVLTSEAIQELPEEIQHSLRVYYLALIAAELHTLNELLADFAKALAKKP